MRYALSIEYDGTHFSGWQRQKTHLTIQEALEVALSKFIPDPVQVVGASRTDSGVHALGQVAHLDLKADWDSYKLMCAMNFHLNQHPIRVMKVEQVDSSFNARKSTKIKEYTYKIIRENHPLEFKRAWVQYRNKLNLKSMEEGAKFLLGTHDFSSFRSGECQALTPVKTLDSIVIKEYVDELRLTFVARSFLQHQIRKMVGMLALCGAEQITPEEIQRILEAKDRRLCTAMAPPWGLYLNKIVY